MPNTLWGGGGVAHGTGNEVAENIPNADTDATQGDSRETGADQFCCFSFHDVSFLFLDVFQVIVMREEVCDAGAGPISHK